MKAPRPTKSDLLAAVAKLRRSAQRATARGKRLEARVAELEAAAENDRRRLSESQDRETATAEILRAISGAPTDVQPVFDTIVRNAAVLCGATDTVLMLVDGDEFMSRAHHGLISEVPGTRYPLRGTVSGRAVSEARVVQVKNLAEADDFPAGKQLAQDRGYQTTLAVPLIREGVAIGAISIRRAEVRLFTDKQIALLQTFADQAVIAIENVRLFTELQEKNRALTEAHARVTEALEQQTATAEILGVISASPTDVLPVFQKIAVSATRLCNAVFTGVFRFDGDLIHFVADHNVGVAGLAAMRDAFPMRPNRGSATARAILTRSPVNIADIETDPDYRQAALARAVGSRSILSVPVLREGTPIGAISVTRAEMSPFGAREIALLRTFADQAVIAIENVRLFTELQEKNEALTQAHAQVSEALEQQTATAEVLRVISSSPTDLQPVFDSILRSAVQLSGARMGGIYRFDGELMHLAGVDGATPDAAELHARRFPRTPDRGFVAGRAILERGVAQMPDALADPEFESKDFARAAGWRSSVSLPMLRDGVPIGAISVARTEIGIFSANVVGLLQTFADQAVIAIENVRLFTELEARNRDLTEALEQQTATSEILRVISRSQTDVQPVFDTIVRNAVRLCGALYGDVYRFDGELIHFVAQHNVTLKQIEPWRRTFPRRLREGGELSRAIVTGSVVCIPNVEADDVAFTPSARALMRSHDVRSLLIVPMLRQNQVVGVIDLTHQQIDAFSNAQVELLQTFADQAVIAIENVRLFTELQASNRELTTALDTQTATSDILRVISRSQTNVQPVFDAIVASAIRLLGAYTGELTRIAGDQIELAALTSTDDAGDAATRVLFPRSLHSEGTHAQAIRDRAPVNVADAHTDPRVPEAGHAAARLSGHRSRVVVPMLRHDEAIGTIGVTRREPGGFTNDEIALLQTFADQAVIAIENARLFNELQEKNRALTEAHTQVTEALEQQTATSEILRVISSSPTDVQPVFDAIVRSAVRLCSGFFGFVLRYDGHVVTLAAEYNVPPEGLAGLRRVYPGPPIPEGVSGRALLSGAVVHEHDATSDAAFPGTARLAKAIGCRTIASIPMVRDGQPIGVINVARRERLPFSETEFELLKTFADQAVIAIENVRLFTELQASNRELTTSLDTQTATSDILRVISGSQTDAQPVFDAIVDSAVRLLRGYAGALTRIAGDQIELAAINSTDDAGDAAARAYFPQSLHSEGLHAQAIRDRAPFHTADAHTDPRVPEGTRALAHARGYRSVITLPMLRHDEAVGTIAVTRREPGGFTDDEIALLQTFADQAVIAIENVRLFRELETRNNDLSVALEQQTATSEILRVISRSQTDVQPVFDTIARSATQLCAGLHGAVLRYDGDLMHLVAHHGFPVESLEEVRQRFPQPPGRNFAGGRAITERRVVHIPDLGSDPAAPSDSVAAARSGGYRSLLAVPMMRGRDPVGSIVVSRGQAAFSDQQIELVKTFADQAVIAIENVRLFTELQASNRELTTALDTQTATSDILRVISRSQTDVQPVFDAIVASAVRLLGAYTGELTRIAGDQIEIAALTSTDAAADATILVRALFPRSLQSEGTHAQAIRDRAPVNIADAHTDARVPEAGHAAARISGHRSRVAVPLLRHDEAVGAIAVTRREAGGFTDDEIALLQTFADQAVIAIENARLFNELQEKNRALTAAHAQVSEALEQQTATSEILRTISSSPTHVQPVFDTIVRSAERLLGGLGSVLALRVGDELHLGALTSTSEAGDEAIRQLYPIPVSAPNPHATAVRDRAPQMIADTEELADRPRMREIARMRGYRSNLVVPLLREGVAIGALGVIRAEPGAFTNGEMALLKTFADQAVIAIENVRLFTELQASNRELTTALDTQTATSDILRVISRSQTDVQPVFDAIVASAVRLLGAYTGTLTRIAGDQIELAAITSTDDAGDAAMRSAYPRSLQSEHPHAQAIRDRAPLNIADTHTDPRWPEAARAVARARGFRSVVAVPLLRHDEAVGAIAVTRREPGGFTDDEVALLQTFADQAVIAIENARLLSELQTRTQELTRSVDQLTALGEVGQAVSSSLELETVLNTILSRAVQLAGANAGTIWEYDDVTEEFTLRITQNVDDSDLLARRNTKLRKGEGAVGRLAVTHEPIQIPDITLEGAYESRLRDVLVGAGMRALLAVPLLREDRILGGLVMSRRTPGEFSPEVVDVLKTFATQSALAIQNARLFREIEQKSRELETASQHKSEFLASMSHELRTPLNAIIGFSDVLLEKMFGEINEKQTEYMQDILSSGKHLLSLINDILDLSKIEAGRMELDLAEFDLPQAIDDALMLMHERATRRGIEVERVVDERLGEIRADERKVKQVLINLLSNAVKFTPEGGRIDVRAGVSDGMAEISVTDTGIGIAPEDQDAVFEEFKQVGRTSRKIEGTGLGLALCRKFIELHGGRIWVKSQVGQGSTFTFTIPGSRVG